MKTLIPAAILLLAGTTLAQDAATPAAPPEEIPVATQARALITFPNGQFEEIWIDKATPTQFRYRINEVAIDRALKSVSDVSSIYFFEPRAYKIARDLYQGRQYGKARVLFGRITAALKEIRELPNNYGTLASFYELECLRQLGELEELKTALEGFRSAGLTREHHLAQIEIYRLWDAVRTKSWPRLDAMCVERRPQKLPGYQRAQIAYCHGLALEGLDRPVAALNAYATAITADYGASSELVSKAALNSLRIYKKDPEVQLAIKLWGTDDENPNSSGRFRLEEAAALADTFGQVLGAGKPLPAEFKEFLKYKPKSGE